jgi:Rrf2 family protein
MKFSTQEEYGLRCLIRLGRFHRAQKSLTIPELSQIEGISEHTVAKLLRILRIARFIQSERGHTGGYSLAKEPDKIMIGDVMNALGGRLYDDSFCESHSGINDLCAHSVDCSVRSLWGVIQSSVDRLVYNLTLQDLIGSERELLNKANVISGE